MSAHLRLIPFLLIASVLVVRAAGIDDLSVLTAANYPQVTLWENAPGATEWVAGPRPRWDWDEDLHLVTLEPGESFTVRLPAGERLRLRSPDGVLGPDTLEVAYGDGNRLLAGLAPLRVEGGRDLVYAPRSRVPTLVRVTWPRAGRVPLSMAVFLSQRQALPDPRPHRDAVPLDTHRSTLWTDGSEDRVPVHRIAPGVPIHARIEGPGHFRLDSRLLYPAVPGDPHRDYRLGLSLEGRPWRAYLLEAAPAGRHVHTLDGQPVTVSRGERVVFSLPDGVHELGVGTDVPVVMALSRLSAPDYLFPDANQPRPPLLSPIDTPAENSVLEGGGRTPAGMAARADRVARDNAHREGALAAAAWLEEASRRHHAFAPLARFQERLLGRQTFYRTLYPSALATGKGLERRYFSPTRLRAGDQPTDRYVLDQGHLTATLAGVPAAAFAVLRGKRAALTYPIPARPVDSALRIIVHDPDRSAERRLRMQVDDRPPVSLSVLPRQLPRAVPDALGGVDVALSIVDSLGDGPFPPTVAGLFAARREPAELIPGAVLEMPLPASARQVRLWREDAGEDEALVAIQYRASRPHALSDVRYLALVDRAGGSASVRALVRRALEYMIFSPEEQEPPLSASILAPDAVDAVAVDRLLNDLLPVLRMLANPVRAYRAAVRPLPARSAAGLRHEAPPGAPVARRLEREDRWVEAFEAWSARAWTVTGEALNEARLGQATALFRLGEAFLAERLLRAVFLQGGDPAPGARAFERLERYYRRQGRNRDLRSLRTLALVRRDTPNHWHALVDLLLDADRPELATRLGVLAPPDPARFPSLLEAAYGAEWWRVFESLRDSVDRPTAELWAGYRAQYEGALRIAWYRWREAGPDGRRLANALLQGGWIGRRLVSASPAEREEARGKWEAWQREHPGPRVWRRAAGVVAGAAGAELVYSPGRNLWGTFYRTDAGVPVRFRVVGPTRLRLRVRPLHDEKEGWPVDTWLTVFKAEGARWVLPITGNRVSVEVERLAPMAGRPGEVVEAVLDVPAGDHEYAVSLPGRGALIGADVERPALPMTTLPPLTAETARVIADRALMDADGARAGIICDQWAAPEGRRLWDCAPPNVRSGEPHRRVAGMQRPTTVRPWWRGLHLLPDGEMAAQASRTRRPVVPPHRWLVSLDGDGARESARSPAALWARGVRTLWSLEHGAGGPMAQLSLLESLSESASGDAPLARLARRAGREAVWSPVEEVESSAGLRYVEVRGWSPESAMGRIRRALVSPPSDPGWLLGDDAPTILYFVNLAPTRVELALRLREPDFLPASSARVGYRVDAGRERFLRLDARRGPGRLVFDLPEGEHTITLRHVESLVNQFVSLSVREDPPPAGVTDEPPGVIRRVYQLATEEEPLVLRLMGPGRIRIDELRDRRVLSETRDVKPGTSRLRLRPAEGLEEAQYRVFKRSIVPGRRPASPRPRMDMPREVRGPRLKVAEYLAPHRLTLVDVPTLGHQGAGTRGLRLAWVSRRGVEEDRRGSRDPERFLELRGLFRRYDAHLDRHLGAELMVRNRHQGGPTLGTRLVVTGRPKRMAPRLRVTGELTAFVQSPGAALDWRGRREWSLKVSARATRRTDLDRKTWNLLRAEGFVRWLSTGNADRYRPERVDQDVFTQYKSDHRRGLRLSDTLFHRPWLDTLWYGGIGMTTNADLDPFDPDHWTVRAGWRQLIGGLRLDGEYRLRHYRADGERERSVNRRYLDLALDWTGWHRGLERVNARLSLSHEIEAHDTSIMLRLGIWEGNGRGYRDLLPGEVPFRDLRERRYFDEARHNQAWERGAP